MQQKNLGIWTIFFAKCGVCHWHLLKVGLVSKCSVLPHSTNFRLHISVPTATHLVGLGLASLVESGVALLPGHRLELDRPVGGDVHAELLVVQVHHFAVAVAVRPAAVLVASLPAEPEERRHPRRRGEDDRRRRGHQDQQGEELKKKIKDERMHFSSLTCLPFPPSPQELFIMPTCQPLFCSCVKDFRRQIWKETEKN